MACSALNDTLTVCIEKYLPFTEVTERALKQALHANGLVPEDLDVAEMAEAYNKLAPFPDAAPALHALAEVASSQFTAVIFSNGTPEQLENLLEQPALAKHSAVFKAMVSVDAVKVQAGAGGISVPCRDNWKGRKGERGLAGEWKCVRYCGSKSIRYSNVLGEPGLRRMGS